LGRQVNACKAKHLTVPKLEKALLAYFANIPNTEPDGANEVQAKQAAAARIEELQKKINLLDEKEKEILDLYIEDKATLAEYRSVKTKLDAEKENILAGIKKLTPSETKVYSGNMTKEEIALTFCKEWKNYTGKEKRQFLVNHIGKIGVINQPVAGTQQGVYEIIEVIFNAYK
jgi:redox-regulated HSP33 family molecular chaperone